MIDFELSDGIQTQRQMVHAVAEQAMRPIAREYDEREHEKPWDFLNMMWQVSSGHPVSGATEKKPRQERPERNLAMCVSIEELSWGDAGLYLSIPNTGLGGAAVAAAGTSEQKERFLARFGGGKPKWAAMAITEPGCGSDSSALQTTAHRDGEQWVIKGIKGARATFDATRPIVAASAIGVGRAALDFVKDTLKEHDIEIRYGLSPHKLTVLERDVMEMEAHLQAARLLTWRAAWMMDNGLRNNLEASMAKAKAGLVVTQITQKAVEILGPLGYSRQLLLEKWMRDAKINDIFEGTQQINQLIVARRILGYSSKELS